ncbi:MAG: glycosyltransferase [Bacteroidales bacterium]|nr:glycosyltransferase [Bacteroidales bacterium]
MNTIYVALPAMDELEYLPSFIDCYRNQTFLNKKLVICVNQPESWRNKPDKAGICQRNVQSLDFLRSFDDIQPVIIDKCSPGNGWTGKKYGVGWARKTVMDYISEMAGENDIIISLDADTTFNPEYFKSVSDTLSSSPGSAALSVPYYHLLTGNEEKDRAILRYEIYMRYYALNLWRTNSFYSFTAIGSAIALTVKNYRAVGGITPHKSGEDFYFIQKLRKYGKVLTHNPEKVYPAARFSDRVGFGTGPAMIKGRSGNWESYPIYPHPLFDLVDETTNLFNVLYAEDVKTPMDDFLKEKFGTVKIWQALRDNVTSEVGFVKACHHKIDALRILQFLKWKHLGSDSADENNLRTFMLQFFSNEWKPIDPGKNFSFDACKVDQLDEIRNVLAGIEENYQKNETTR